MIARVGKPEAADVRVEHGRADSLRSVSTLSDGVAEKKRYQLGRAMRFDVLCSSGNSSEEQVQPERMRNSGAAPHSSTMTARGAWQR